MIAAYTKYTLYAVDVFHQDPLAYLFIYRYIYYINYGSLKMAKTQKDIKEWDILIGSKKDGRNITICRKSDNLQISEGDCISFKSTNKTLGNYGIIDELNQQVYSLGFVKNIEFGLNNYLEIKILWFIKFNRTLKASGDIDSNSFDDNDIFMTALMDKVMLDQIINKHKIISINDLKDGDQIQDTNTFICRRFVDETNTYFTDIIDWDLMIQSFKENKNEFFETVKMLTAIDSFKPKNNVATSTEKVISYKAKKIETEVEGSDASITDADIEDDESDVSFEMTKQEEDENEDDDEDQDEDEKGSSEYNMVDPENDLIDDSEEAEDYSHEDENYTVSRKRKLKNATSPRKKKRISRKRTKQTLRLPYVEVDKGVLDLDSNTDKSTEQLLLEAKKALGIGTKLKSLPCREEEFYQLYNGLESSINSNQGCCIYVSGTPGVGKTATIREVIKQLSAKMTIDNNGKKMFYYLEINGLKLIKPQQAYEILWKKISGNVASSNASLDYLQQYFEDQEDSELPLVVLLDELDQIVTKNQSVMYNFFNWPTYLNSKLIVIAVANTMDLPERLLTNKISSRLGLSRIQFTSYSYLQLSEIIKHRLEEISKSNDKLIIAKDAIEFASRKVASVSGDARRSLMICVRAVEIAEAEFKKNKKLKPDNDHDNKYTVTIMHIMKAVNEASSSPIIGYLNSLPFLSKLVLACIMIKKKRNGIAEISIGEIFDELSNQAEILLFSEIKNKLNDEELTLLDIIYGNEGDLNNSNNRKNGSVINCSLYIMKELEENGILMMQNLKIERNRLIRLNISDDEILNCLKKDGNLKELIIYTS